MNVSAAISSLNTPGAADLLPRANVALHKAQKALLDKQDADGFWVGELQGDSILESEYILLKFILGQESDPRLEKIGKYLHSLQTPEGGWSLFPGGPPDLSGTVKAYFALKLLGHDANSPYMRAARQIVLKSGGAENATASQNSTSPPWARSVTTPARPSHPKSSSSPSGFISISITSPPGPAR